MPDVVVVHDGDFVGVAAPSEIRPRIALWPRSRPSGNPVRRSPARPLRRPESDRDGRRGEGGNGWTAAGSIKEGLDAADVRLEQTYTIAYIAHAPLEPRAAVAQWENGKLTVWTGTQRPFGVRGELTRGVPAS